MNQEVFPVTEEWTKRAFIDRETYERMYAQAAADPDTFWQREAQRIDWIKPFTKVKETSFNEADFGIKWFAEDRKSTRLNSSH